METLNLGIDDAGRGPVIGPMILAGVIINEEAEKELRKLGVKDSKQLTQKRREFIEAKIKELATSFYVESSSAEKIDHSMETGTNLNELEAINTADIINELNKDHRQRLKIVVDCPSTSILKWTDSVRQKVKHLANLEISCEHKADHNHISVGAASILAKCERERAMDKLKEEYGTEIGSGYTSDPATIRFLELYTEKHKDKGIFRKTWATYKRIHKDQKQKTLF